MPTNWQQSRVLMAKLGQYVVTARKDRNSENWYVGGMTNEQARDLTLHFDFLDKGMRYKAIIYRDGDGATYQGNPYPLAIDQQLVSTETLLPIHLAKGGGFAIQLIKQ